LLQQLAQSSEPRTQLRAIGYLCALGQASPKQVALLKEALRSDRINSLSAAAEACRICRDPALAAVLVNPAALIPLGDAPLAGGAQPESTGLYASYALAYLPGDQAKLLRTKLLDAADKRIRWQGRLGELLHGDIKPWYDAVLAADPGDPDMWLTIQPESVADPALLLTYKKTADAADPEVRLRTAQHLNRYGAAASDRLVGEILAKLIADEVPEVAAQAWHSAAVIRLPGRGNAAQLAVDDAAQPATVRLAAAFYVMRQAEPADPVQHAAAPEEQK
jgi:hypothetical protein